jgi:hypothetical protein
LSSENIDILRKNNVILAAIRAYGFWEAPKFVNELSFLPVLYFYGLAALDQSLGLGGYDKWWNLPICGFEIDGLA